MTISVIIPVYKVEKYICRCLQSVIGQKCDDFNIECIVVDDCSPDDSMSIVSDMIENYDGNSITFKIISHEQNRGLSEARNSGIKASTGDYLFFIDSDDAILESTFKCYVTYAKSSPSVDIIMGNALNVEACDLTSVSMKSYHRGSCLIDNKRTIIYNVLRRQIDRHAWNKLIRRSIIVENDLFFESGLLYEDITWTYRLYSIVSSVLIVPELTYMYDCNPSSIMHTHIKHVRKIVWSFVFTADFIFNNPPVIDGKKVLYTEHSLFVNHWMLLAIDLYQKYGADKLTQSKLKTLKRKMFWTALCHLRPVLALYFLTMFKPLCWLIKIRMFRANIFRIIYVVYKLS